MDQVGSAPPPHAVAEARTHILSAQIHIHKNNCFGKERGILNKVMRRFLISSGCQNIKQMTLRKCQRVGQTREDAVTRARDVKMLVEHAVTPWPSLKSPWDLSRVETGLAVNKNSGRSLEVEEPMQMLRDRRRHVQTYCSMLRTSRMAVCEAREISS